MADRKPLVIISGQTQEIPSGDKVPIASIATGTPDGTKFIRDDGVLATPAGGVSSVSGTLNRVTSSGGSTPVIDISASYVGQSSITTVGTITSGGLGTGAVVGGVTMTLGSDAANDIYYRNGSGVLTRLANGSTGQYLSANTGAAPSWATPSAGLTVGTSAITSGSSGRVLYNNAGTLGEMTTIGSGTVLVLATSPTLTTPVLGVATATSINKVIITAPTTTATLTLVTGSTLATVGAFSITFTSTNTTTVTLPTSGVIYSNQANSISPASIFGALSTKTGTGNPVFHTSPTFVTSITLPTGATGQVPVLWVSGALKTTAVAGGAEFNGSYYETKASGLRYASGGVIADFTADVNAGSTTETDLFTYTTPASTLAATGEKLIGEFGINITDASTGYNFKVYFAGTSVDLGNFTIASGVVPTGGYIKAMVIRTGATTARIVATMVSDREGTANGSMTGDLTGITFTNTNIIKVTGTGFGGSATSGDLVAKLGTIYWYGAAAN